MGTKEVDTDKPLYGYSITKDTAISLAVLIPLVAMFVGAIMWMTTVHAKVGESQAKVTAMSKELADLKAEQRAQLDRYIAIEVKLGELKGLLTNKK